MHRSLIIAKIAPGTEQQVADIWTESDATELPGIAGVTHRSLYRLGDLYVHLLETEAAGPEAVGTARRHPEFKRISDRLDPFISPYLPTWRGPQDALANCFYTWQPGEASS
ncbi:MAG TPA: TcmI family type II polyketide cyclase [Pseudonocardiaceae bacterium]|jgi:cyclase|nr:TcmI family type II polyketide cyclase [Pseudonocardiaceae bacterium]